MDRFIIREFSKDMEENLSIESLEPPIKKRKLIDSAIEKSSNSVKKTLEIYKGALVQDTLQKETSIFSSLSNEECISYTNMTRDQFNLLFLEIEPDLLQPFKKGRKVLIPLKDSVLLYITRLKTGVTFEILAVDFQIKNASTIFRVCERIETPLHDALTKKYFTKFGKAQQLNLGIRYDNFPEVALIVDSTFQPCNRPGLNFSDAKVFFSGKHGAYGIKKETAHLPDGRLAMVSPHVPVSMHYIALFRSHLPTYKVIFFFGKFSNLFESRIFYLKKSEELSTPDPIRSATSWAILADKGYVGLEEEIRIITPKKGSNLSFRRKF